MLSFRKHVVAVAGIGLALTACTSTAPHRSTPQQSGAVVDATASPSPASELWTGTTYTAKSRSMGWLSAGYTAQGSFWFRVAADGSVSGHATVTYVPTADHSGTDNRISYLKGVVGSVGGLLGIPGAGAGLAMNGLSGLEVDWDQPMTVQQGAIVGSMQGGKLSLRWADDSMTKQGLGVKVYLVYLAPDPHNDLLSTTSLGVDTPWPATATVSGAGGQLFAEGKAHTSTHDGDVEAKTDAAWQAVQGG